MRTLLLALAATLVMAAPAEAVPQWLAPVDLGAETPDPSSIGRVALGGDGTAVAAWAQSVPSGPSWVLQVARRKPGEGYGAPITVPDTSGDLSNVRVGVDSTGNATVLYKLGSSLVVVPWPSAAPAPGVVQPLPGGNGAELAVGRNGTAVATWLDVGNPNQPFVRASVRPGASGDFGPGNQISAPGNGMLTITGLGVAVGDGGHATVVWSRTNAVPQTIVEANERPPGGDFSNMGTSVSNTTNGAATEPAVAVDAAGRSTVLWTNAGFGQVRYVERAQGDPLWSSEEPASQVGTTSDMPAAAAAPGGAVIAAWRSSGTIVSAARPAGGGAFAGFQPLSGPGMNASLPLIAVGGNGDALISWSLIDQKSIPTVQRKANGTFGPLLVAVTAANQPPGEEQNFFQPSIGIDDEGNGVAAWTRNAFRNPTNFNRFQTASFDAAAPVLSATVPPGGVVGTPVGMAAAAVDRVSPVAITWAFGDGGTATGGAASHAFGAAGAFNVGVTATDAAGNATSATRPVLVTAVAAQGPQRISSPVRITWGVRRKEIYLLRLKVLRVPKGGKVELRCAGKKCPKRKSSKKRRKGAITLFKEIKPAKAVGKKPRSFRAGQRVDLRITAPRYIGKVARYKLRKGKIPSARRLCLPQGAKKPRRSC